MSSSDTRADEMTLTRKLRIVIATAGRFHVLDLARELSLLGHEVDFLSYVPCYRLRHFGYCKPTTNLLFLMASPILIWGRILKPLAPELRERALFWVLNQGAIWALGRCDVFIFLSGIYLEAAYYAKYKYGAKLIVERGSRHILEQDEILKNAGAERPTRLVIRRELEAYEIADVISVPSQVVAASFESKGISSAKIFRNPYGVNLADFPMSLRGPPLRDTNVLFVGTWSLQKGCDLLVEAVRRTEGLRLVHVGSIGDMTFPVDDPRFVHWNAVDQKELHEFYGSADVFVLPSRQEGLGLVMAQALVSGLPVVASDATGITDLTVTDVLRERCFIFRSDHLHEFLVQLDRAVLFSRDVGHRKRLTNSERETLSWTRYGHRYHEFLLKLFE